MGWEAYISRVPDKLFQTSAGACGFPGIRFGSLPPNKYLGCQFGNLLMALLKCESICIYSHFLARYTVKFHVTVTMPCWWLIALTIYRYRLSCRTLLV